MYKKQQDMIDTDVEQSMVTRECLDWGIPPETFRQTKVLPKDNSEFTRAGYVGFWEVSEGVFFNIKKKPNFIHQYFTKLLLGWEWKSYV